MVKVIDLDKNTEELKPAVVGLGNFDGIHIGHRQIMDRVLEVAKEKNLKSSVLLFKQHTNEIFKKRPSRYLTSLEDKIEILDQIGIEQVFIVDFTFEFAQLTNEEFILKFIGEDLNAKSIVVGRDYTFGKFAKGTVTELREYNDKNLIDVNVVDPIFYNDDMASSTIIRIAIKEGNVDQVEELLTHNYWVNGKVVDGEKRGGKILGFPTANIDLDFNYLIPNDALYLTYIWIDGKKYPSLTSIGTNPTFTDSEDIKIECFIIDFDENIYGKKVRLEFIKKTREQIKFDSKEALIDQMNYDLDQARIFFKNDK